jgi:hypothetical protein
MARSLDPSGQRARGAMAAGVMPSAGEYREPGTQGSLWLADRVPQPADPSQAWPRGSLAGLMQPEAASLEAALRTEAAGVVQRAGPLPPEAVWLAAVRLEA